MKELIRHKGFSLVEVLMAVGILSVGMVFIAGIFPVLHFSTVATERSIAAVAADEAFAKVRLWGVDDPNVGGDNVDLSRLYTDHFVDFNEVDVFPLVEDMNSFEYYYPSVGKSFDDKQYHWRAFCRLVDLNAGLVQVTVFVSRKVGIHLKYYEPQHDIADIGNYGVISDPALPQEGIWPVLVKVEVDRDAGSHAINETGIVKEDEKVLINDGYKIMDDRTGEIYTVLERTGVFDDVLVLDREWESTGTSYVWVVPPPITGGRGPCVGIFQKLIKF